MRKIVVLIGCLLLISILNVTPSRPVMAQDHGCRWSPLGDTLVLFSAPIESYSHLLYLLPATEDSYLVLYQHDPRAREMFDNYPFYYITVDEEIQGWVTFFHGGYAQGENCHETIPMDTTPINDFPGICDTVVGRSATEYFLGLSHAMGYYAPIGEDELYRTDCPGLEYHPTPAFTRGSVHVRSAPNAHTGDVLDTLPPLSKLFIIDGPVRGPIEADSDSEGAWYRVFMEGYPTGWVWAEQLDIITSWHEARNSGEDLFANETQPVTVNSWARLWTLPDIHTGRGMSWVPAGTELQAVHGPVPGPIRYDSDEIGDWYYVSGRSYRGWIWGGYLLFEDQ